MTELTVSLDDIRTTFEFFFEVIVKRQGIATDEELAFRLREAGFDYTERDVAELKDGRSERSPRLIMAVGDSLELETREELELWRFWCVSSPYIK